MEPTRNGVFRDLASSPFSSEVDASGQRVLFKFATFRHKVKFEETWRPAAIRLKRQVSQRARFDVDMTLPAAVRAYTDAETFGFYIEVDGEPVWRVENLESDGPRLRTSASAAQ